LPSPNLIVCPGFAAIKAACNRPCASAPAATSIAAGAHEERRSAVRPSEAIAQICFVDGTIIS
jgi:hypothetical protein